MKVCYGIPVTDRLYCEKKGHCLGDIEEGLYRNLNVHLSKIRGCGSGTSHFTLYWHSTIRFFPLPQVMKSLKLVIAFTSILRLASWFSVPTWGRSVVFGRLRRRGLIFGSSGKTSSPTDASCEL